MDFALAGSADAPGMLLLISGTHGVEGFCGSGCQVALLHDQTFIAEVEPLPVVLLRCDISAVGMVAHRAFAGFVGWSANTRHGPLPMRRPDRAGGDDERDDSPSVFVPALHSYVKTSKLLHDDASCGAAGRSACLQTIGEGQDRGPYRGWSPRPERPR